MTAGSTNKSRQPVTQKAVGDPNKGRPAGVISQVGNKGNVFTGKPVEPGPSDES